MLRETGALIVIELTHGALKITVMVERLQRAKDLLPAAADEVSDLVRA